VRREAVATNVGRAPVRVSFSGLDGAGKTRQIDELVAALRDDCTVEVLWIPFKIWPETLLNRLPAKLRSRLGPSRKASATSDALTGAKAPAQLAAGPSRGTGGPGRRSLLTPLRPALWTGVGTFAAVSAGLSLRRRARGSDAGVLILDRYRLDSIVKLQFWYPDVSADLLARVLRALAPEPDVEFLLRVDPEVAYARKPEQWSVEQLTRQARLYDRLAATSPRIVVLDAHADPDELARSVVAQVQVERDAH